MPSSMIFPPRSRVRIIGLRARPELNGLQGEIEKFVPESGRYAVAVKIPTTAGEDGAHPPETTGPPSTGAPTEERSLDDPSTADKKTTSSQSLGLKPDNLILISFLERGHPPAIDVFLPPKNIPNYACEMFGVSEEMVQMLLEKQRRAPQSLSANEEKLCLAYQMQAFSQEEYEELYQADPLSCGDPHLVEDDPSDDEFGGGYGLRDKAQYQSMHRMMLWGAVVDLEKNLHARRDVSELLLAIMDKRIEAVSDSTKQHSTEQQEAPTEKKKFEAPAKLRPMLQRIVDEFDDDIQEHRDRLRELDEEEGRWSFQEETGESDVDTSYLDQQKNIPHDVHIYLYYCEGIDRKLARPGADFGMDGEGLDARMVVTAMKLFRKELIGAYREACGGGDVEAGAAKTETGPAVMEGTGVVGEQTEGTGRTEQTEEASSGRSREAVSALRGKLMPPADQVGARIGFGKRMLFAKKVWNDMLTIYLHHANARNQGGDTENGLKKAVAFARLAYGLA